MAANNEARQRTGGAGAWPRLTYYPGPGVYRNMRNKVVTPSRLAAVGVLCCAAGLTWMLVWERSVHRPDTEIIAIDYYAPLLPRFIFLSGILLLLTSGVWELVAKLHRHVGGD